MVPADVRRHQHRVPRPGDPARQAVRPVRARTRLRHRPHRAARGLHLRRPCRSRASRPTILCLALLGAFYAATDGILAALASESTPAESRGTGIASAQTVVALSRLIASTGFGLLWFAVGREAAMFIVAIALAIVIPIVDVPAPRVLHPAHRTIGEDGCMTSRARVWLLAGLTVVLLGGAIAYAVVAFADYQSRANAPSQVQTVDSTSAPSGPRIVFRNTASGAGYGLVASVPLSDPAAARTVTSQACDRVYATERLRDVPARRPRRRDHVQCDAVRPVVEGGEVVAVAGHPEPHPHLARLEARRADVVHHRFVLRNGRLLDPDHDLVDVRNGLRQHRELPVHRRRQGGDGGRPQLLGGDLRARTTTRSTRRGPRPGTPGWCAATWPRARSRRSTRRRSARRCHPTARRSPTRRTYRPPARRTGRSPCSTSRAAKRRCSPITDNVDDQALWLDDSTLLYGLTNPKVVGDSNIWSVAIDGASAPRLFLAHAWSPSIVR